MYSEHQATCAINKDSLILLHSPIRALGTSLMRTVPAVYRAGVYYCDLFVCFIREVITNGSVFISGLQPSNNKCGR